MGFTRWASDGTNLSGATGFSTGTFSNPLGIAVDGAGNAWVTSDTLETINGTPTSVSWLVELNNSGTILSGANGYMVPPAALGYPVGVATDGSGNVWVVMSANKVVEMVGVAAPVVTPLSLGVKNGTMGTRP